MTRALLLTVVALTLSGCLFKKKPKAQVPPTPVSDVQMPAQMPRAGQTSKPAAGTQKSPAKRKPAVSTQRAASPAAIPPKAAETKKTPPAPTPASSQQLGQILSPDERDQYRATYERSSLAAREMLKAIAGRQLAGGSVEAVGRIHSFLAQAQEAATRDWPAAAQLAYRAEVLARDLARLLQ
jgi:hypothetical protein